MPKDQYMCQLCANHGIFDQPKRGHKEQCPHKDCPCQTCSLNTKRRTLDRLEREIKREDIGAIPQQNGRSILTNGTTDNHFAAPLSSPSLTNGHGPRCTPKQLDTLGSVVAHPKPKYANDYPNTNGHHNGRVTITNSPSPQNILWTNGGGAHVPRGSLLQVPAGTGGLMLPTVPEPQLGSGFAFAGFPQQSPLSHILGQHHPHTLSMHQQHQSILAAATSSLTRPSMAPTMTFNPSPNVQRSPPASILTPPQSMENGHSPMQSGAQKRKSSPTSIADVVPPKGSPSPLILKMEITEDGDDKNGLDTSRKKKTGFSIADILA